ncbi:hypothetical protein KJJ93_27215, partial [Escherichia coli]|uniref:hypothetical protein n=1 Tax=Escherichia coli TaxID=562 RepID=UPI001BD97E75
MKQVTVPEGFCIRILHRFNQSPDVSAALWRKLKRQVARQACFGPHYIQKVTVIVILPFEVTGFNPPDFHVAQQRFKTNPDHSQIAD